MNERLDAPRHEPHAEPAEYVVAHIRQRLALGGAAELGIAVEVAEDHVRLSGWVTSAGAREQVIAAAQELAEHREVIDDLELASAEHEPGRAP